jgi:hypothetical protein
MKTGITLSLLLVTGALLLPASPALANVQSAQDLRATSSIPSVAQFRAGQFQLVQGTGSRTGRGCPKNYRWDYRSQQCVKM